MGAVVPGLRERRLPGDSPGIDLWALWFSHLFSYSSFILLDMCGGSIVLLLLKLMHFLSSFKNLYVFYQKVSVGNTHVAMYPRVEGLGL